MEARCSCDGIGVYMLTDSRGRRTYIGYSTDVPRRYRCHCLRLRASARYTKGFDSCHLKFRVNGFPTKQMAMRFEWLAKTKRPLALRRNRPDVPGDCVIHKRMFAFFAPLMDARFKKIRKLLRAQVYLKDIPPEKQPHLLGMLSEFYDVVFEELVPPFHPSHFC